MNTPSPQVWLNDRLWPQAEASIAVADRGFLLADGLFETIRITNGAPCHFAAHLRRLHEGCAVLALPPPRLAKGGTLADALQATLAANGIIHGSARLTWSRGAGPRGLLPSGS
jgi:branched-chain amino acid aminotransferase